YWGKAEKDTGKYHLLPYHCLDVAAVGAAWWEGSPTIQRCFTIYTTNDVEQIKAWILFFIALHDYGKIDARFQLRAKPVWDKIYLDAGNFGGIPSVLECKHYIHGEGGLSWFRQDQAELFNCDSSFDGLDFLDYEESSVSRSWKAWKPWVEAVMGHHGYMRDADYINATSLSPSSDKRLSRIDREARRSWLVTLEEIFLKPVGLQLSDAPPPCSAIFLAGFCSISDWLGSHCDTNNFILCQEPQDLLTYFEARRTADAPRILKFAGVFGRTRPYLGVKALLDKAAQPRSMQTIVDAMPLQPGMTIIEAPTGSGKTEAALAYAWRLIVAGLADSIVFALPTQATANAMLSRLVRIAPLLFESNPNLLLAHGSSRYNREFTKIKHAALDEYAQEDGWVQCSQWLTESRKRVFLGQLGVCTIDQVLISVLPVKHRFVRGFGIGRSILIVDEVHAYDAYMYGLLEEVLRQQKEAGGSAILLSATLPQRQRTQLLSAWDVCTEEEGQKTPYPLAICADSSTYISFELAPEHKSENITVTVEPMRVPEMIPDEMLLTRMVHAAEAGAQVALVCNLVAVAQDHARRLRAMTTLPVDLFHARFSFRHRQEKEIEAINNFGPKGKRATGRILVATQVVEQSLDLDFDWLLTQICPVDLLFQRLGRLHRHKNSHRPIGFEKPLCTILLPQNNDFGLHGKIYSNTRVLWRTAEKLLKTPEGKIMFPHAYRAWIEPIYQEAPWDNEPPEQTSAFEMFKDNVEYVKKYLAAQMVERTRSMISFDDSDDTLLAVTRDGEMNLTVVPFFRSSQGKTLMDGTVLETLDENNQIEAVSLNSIGVPKSWVYFLGDAVDGKYWLEMEPEGQGFRALMKGTTFRYHKDIGLEKERTQ
ncbi:MAG TPA: CRISPR-associated helicase/endonuclease Cas3, partial [Alphaproteobacteria bacterium]|nr:CRISPR-associated helicase/endonuclease Cas3 [Alphaproteobacteria bacterium]